MAFDYENVTPDKKTGIFFRGREIVLAKVRGRAKGGLTAKGIEKGMYPEEKKIEVVTVYATTGNAELTEELTKVSVPTIKKWKKEAWFQNYLQEIREENGQKLDAFFTRIAEKALQAVEDRIANGDFHVTRDGDVIRKPMSGKDLSLVTAINIDKRQLLRGEPTSRSESVGGNLPVVTKLENLAKTFEDLARHGRKPKLIDVEDAVVVENAQIAP